LALQRWVAYRLCQARPDLFLGPYCKEHQIQIILHGGQAVAQALIPAAVGAPAAPQTFPRAGGFQGGFADLMTAALPPGVASLNIDIPFASFAIAVNLSIISGTTSGRAARCRSLRVRPERRRRAQSLVP
jgi:hypothetical protein